MSKRWVFISDRASCEAAARRWRVPPIVARLLINRDVSPDSLVNDFLAPQMKDLYPAHQLPGAKKAAERIVRAVREKARIVLYGDYDVDGTTGVAILWHMLRTAGADVSFYVPHRIEEGYGLNSQAAGKLAADGARMIVSIDCGITAVDVADDLRKAGVSLIITDHHQPTNTLPRADTIVHPGLDNTYPNPFLCGAGVAFKLAWAIAQELSGTARVTPELRTLLVNLLPLAALGTIADVVPLAGENRIIAKHGLSGLKSTPFVGLRALMELAGLNSGGDSVSGYDVGFKLAPRINAAGRMGHARLAVELLTDATEARAHEIVMYLDGHNRTRQSKERTITKRAYEMIEENGLACDTRRAIVLASEGWHAGVIGIVAARIVDRYSRPAIVISLDGEEGQGSGRSIRSLDLFDALSACAEHLVSFGGHAMAAGVRVAREKVEAFTEAFVEIANNRLSGDDLVPKLRLDAEVALDQLSLETTETIVSLGPFGIGNPKPKLATGWIDLADEPRLVGKNQAHLQASFVENGVRIKAIGFGLRDDYENLKEHRRCRVAFEPIVSEFKGRRSVEMKVLDLHFPQP